MRLGQAARSFQTTTHSLADLIKENFREVNAHPNVKLTEEELVFLNAYFEVEKNEEELSSEEVTTDLVTEQDSPELDEESLDEEELNNPPQFIEELRPKVITLEKEFNEQTEGLDSYKAEKVELEGLKVLGKIDLPEPKIKEEKETSKRDNQRTSKRTEDRRSKKGPRAKKGPSPAELRAKEERLAYKKKIEQEERLKTLKKKHYDEQVKAKLEPAKPKKKKKKEAISSLDDKAQVQKKTTQRKTKKATGLKRFWLWLNGAYDQHD